MSAKLTATVDAAAVDAIFRDYDQGVLPGVAVAIALDGVPVYRKGFGLASIELPVLLSPHIRMRIGSTTKHFTALAYLLLCEDGKADIDDEIGKYLPELHAENRHATVRQLLWHTSGLRDAFEYTMQLYGTNVRVTDEEMLAFYRAAEGVNAEPETEWSYSNGGYMLVATAIARIAGQSFDDFLRERIFVPAGMHDTLMRRWDTEFLPNSAALHLRQDGDSWVQHYMGMDLGGAGGIVSTMDDMLRWLRHMDAPVVGSVQSWRHLTTPGRLRTGESTDYGMGLAIETYRGARTISHSGGVISGSSQMIKVPDVRLDISIAANRSDIGTAGLANRIIDACVSGLDPLPSGLGIISPTGTFLSDRTGRVIELTGDDNISAIAVNAFQMPAKLYADGTVRLPPDMASRHLEIRPAAAEAEAISFATVGPSDMLRRIEVCHDARLPFERASFRSQGGNFAVSLDHCDGKPRLVTERSQIFHLEPITPRVWKALSHVSPYRAGIVTFSEGSDSFTLTTPRNRDLRFNRVAADARARTAD